MTIVSVKYEDGEMYLSNNIKISHLFSLILIICLKTGRFH